MTVGELKKLLHDVDDDLELLIAYGPGNTYERCKASVESAVYEKPYGWYEDFDDPEPDSQGRRYPVVIFNPLMD